LEMKIDGLRDDILPKKIRKVIEHVDDRLKLLVAQLRSEIKKSTAQASKEEEEQK